MCAGMSTARDGEIASLRALRDACDTLTGGLLARMFNRRRIATGGDQHLRQLEELLAFAEPRHLTHPQLRTIKRLGLSVPGGLSFRSLMVQRGEARRIGGADPGWRLDSKLTGYAFADQLGVRRPQSDGVVYPLDGLPPLTAPAVVKPARSTGAKGVYLCFSSDRILHRSQTLASWDEAAAHARTLMATDRPVRDRWIVEELILEAPKTPARDVKFFCFYGQMLFAPRVLWQASRPRARWAPPTSAPRMRPPETTSGLEKLLRSWE
jgi:hypothetical protein